MEATKTTTKKEFEQMLNDKYGVSTQKWGNGNYAAQTRPYGTYLRNQDREKFNVCYHEYLETGNF